MRFFPPLSIGAFLLLMLACPRAASALSVVAPSFSELVAKAETVARVEVTGQSSQWDVSASGQNVIHTYVQCRIIKQLKGSPQETLSLRFLGGRVGTAVMEIPDMPAFAVGKRYIVFVAANGRAFCPLVGVMHGTYPLTTDSSGTDHVLRSNGAALRSTAEIKEPEENPGVSGETGMKRDDFEQAIAQEVSHAASH